MKIVIAPDSFKESLTAEEVAQAIKRGFQKSIADVECLLCPIGDGGEGTVDAIRHSLELEEKWQEVTGPFALNEAMRYFQKGQIALFEVADLVGLGKIPQEKRNPLHIQTRGIGELIRHLIELGMKEINCIRINNLSENEIQTIRIAETRAIELGKWHYQKLFDELSKIGEDFKLTGFDLDEILEQLPAEVLDINGIDEKYADVIVKRYAEMGKEDIKLLRNGKTYNWNEVKSELYAGDVI